MTKGLMDRALHQETVLERVREKARLAGEELLELKSWKVVTEQKLKLAEELKTVLEDKENELRLAKEKGCHQKQGREEQGDGRGCDGDGLEQAPGEETNA